MNTNRDGIWWKERKYHNKEADIQNAYYAGKGRTFGYWIGEDSRNSAITAFSYGNTILNPAYVIESLIRDELHAEHHLTLKMSGVTTGTSATVVVYGCKQLTTNAYVDAWYSHYDALGGALNSHGSRVTASSYSSSTEETTLTLSAAVHRNASSFDLPAKLTDVRGTNPNIDTDSFDDVAQSFSLDDIVTGTSGAYTSLPVNHVINQQAEVQTVISGILLDHFMFLYKDFDTYYLSPLVKDTDFLEGTFSSPLYSDGVPQVKYSLSPLDIVYDKFKFNYAYDYGKGEFKRSITINPRETNFTTIASGYEDALTDACADVKSTYGGRVSQEMTVDLISAKDEEAAYFFIKNFVPFFTQQKMIVTYKADMIGTASYKPGDQVKINVPEMIPTGVNNSDHFIIFSRKVLSKNSNKYYEYKLLQLPN